MFEDSLFESQHRIVSPRGRSTAFASIALQGTITSLLIFIPLLHTESLPERASQLKITVPLAKPAPPPMPKTVVQRASSAMAAVVPALSRMLAPPHIMPNHIENSPDPNASIGMMNMGTASTPGALLGASDASTIRPAVSVAPEKKAGPVRVSAGVSAGLLLNPIRPVYPLIAKAAHVEGTVVVEATISKTGTINSLHVVSGPAMLQSAALDAIRAARYRPFQLNGAPTEVQTTITVNFRMSTS